MMHVWPTASSFASHESTFPLAKTVHFWTKKIAFLALYLLRIQQAETSLAQLGHWFLPTLPINPQLEDKTED